MGLLMGQMGSLVWKSTQPKGFSYVYSDHVYLRKNQPSPPTVFSGAFWQGSKINKKQMDQERDDITCDTPTFIL